MDDGGAEFDVGSAAGHVGGDGDGAGLSGVGDDLGFAGVVFGVEDVVDNVFAAEHAAEDFGGFDGDGSDEDGLLALVSGFDFVDDGFKFFALGFVDLVVEVEAADGAVGGDDHDV